MTVHASKKGWNSNTFSLPEWKTDSSRTRDKTKAKQVKIGRKNADFSMSHSLALR